MSDSENALLIRSLPWRDKVAILSLLGVVTILSWMYLIVLSVGVGMVIIWLMSGYACDMLLLQDWAASYFIAMLLMWVIMMIGMMVPTAVPMALIYAAISRKAAKQGITLVPTSTFVFGYVVMWSLFSLGATLAQWGLDEAALLSPMMVSNSPLFGASLLIAAGLFQLTPYTDACLNNCREPARFISQG